MPGKVFMSHMAKGLLSSQRGPCGGFREVFVNVCMHTVYVHGMHECIHICVHKCQTLVCPSGTYTKMCVYACLHVHVLWFRTPRHTSKLKSSRLGCILFVLVAVCVQGQSAAGRGLIE